ncbi:MAG: hypothetical protein IPI25_00015 [Candidatus Brocadia sp.]|nr:MAG: hypothetical protein IPI25_00015 [Candidatus Brocadia sp.]
MRTIKRLEIAKEGKYILFTVEADGFLYNMVRTKWHSYRGRKGKIMTENVRDILAARNRNLLELRPRKGPMPHRSEILMRAHKERPLLQIMLRS